MSAYRCAPTCSFRILTIRCAFFLPPPLPCRRPNFAASCQAVWYLKCRALTMLHWVDDTDFEEEGVADMLLDENATAALPRPGTSLARPQTSSVMGAPGQGMRPMSASGRPLSGYARPGTGSAPNSRGGVEGAMQGNRPGTARPVTALGRLVRLGTASMLSEAGGPFINADRLDLRKYAARPALAK
eukprot:4998100-Prymnesium_polylepis.1